MRHRSRAENSPSNRERFHRSATFSSPSSDFDPDGDQSAPRQIRIPRAASGRDVGRRPVEPQVRERRPHDRAAARHPPLVLRVAQRRAVDPHEARPEDRVLRQDVVLGHQRRVGPLGEVVDERIPRIQRRLGPSELLRTLQREHRLAHAHPPGAKRLVLDVAHHPALERPPHLRRALDRRHAADDRLRLDVLQHRLAVGLAQRVDRQRDRRQVVAVLGPLVARGPRRRPARRDPQRQAVVGDVVVQVDQTRVDEPPRPCPPGSRARRTPAAADRTRAPTATIRPSASTYSAPSAISGRASSNVTRWPVTTSGAGSSGPCTMRAVSPRRRPTARSGTAWRLG